MTRAFDPAARPEALPFVPPPRLMGGCLGAALLGAALSALGFVLDPQQFFFSYLVAFFYALHLMLGALAFLLAVHAANAGWPVAVRRLPEAVVAAAPLFIVLFVPVVLGARYLYPWIDLEAANGHGAHTEHLAQLLHKRAYLNPPFALGRAAVYLAFWIALGEFLRRLSLRMDRPGAPADLRARLRVLSSVAFPLFGIVGTMAAWDWLMSLEPTWFSTMFGLNVLAGGFLGALALTCLLTIGTTRAGFLPEVGAEHRFALGRLLFAFLVFWAYTWYWQYFLIWIANRPIEVEWFIKRSRGGYGVEGLFLVFGHFALPFFFLLSYWVKRQSFSLGALAAWILLARYFDLHWIVSAARGRPQPFSWQDPAALLLVGGLTVAFALWRQRGHLVAPLYDPGFPRALEYRSR